MLVNKGEGIVIALLRLVIAVDEVDFLELCIGRVALQNVMERLDPRILIGGVRRG